MSELRKIRMELSEHDALILLKLVKHQVACQQEKHHQNCLNCWQQLADQFQTSIETSYCPYWLICTGHVLITGYIRPKWLLVKPLLGLKEQQDGCCLISNETLGIYAVGITEEQGLEDFKSSLINNYQRLEVSAGSNSDLQTLFQKYQSYLQPRA
jgi:hypothetical protein